MCCFGWTNFHYHVALSSLIDSKFNRRWKVTHNKIYVEDEQYICGDGRDVEWLAVNSGRMWPGLVGDNWIKTRMASCCQHQLDRVVCRREAACAWSRPKTRQAQIRDRDGWLQQGKMGSNARASAIVWLTRWTMFCSRLPVSYFYQRGTSAVERITSPQLVVTKLERNFSMRKNVH